MAARVSVVVPVFNVAAYLETCLRSLAEQTVGDELEVIVVDDGSTDGSGELAEELTASDERFRVVRQENAGLGAARNTGVEHARGELIAFVDSDDAVPRHAYETLLDALDRSGSDFASGNVRRLTSLGTTRTAFLAKAFEKTRLGTHVTRFPALLTDRVAWNKLFRRSFWDRHGLRFPEGVLYEDIPVMVPAHYLADAVDVVSETVYLWRLRPGADSSITQRRTEARAIRDRIGAVDHVSRFLAKRGLEEDKLRYDLNVLGDDLRRFLIVLDHAEPVDRELFIQLANDFIDRADPAVLDQPLALDRLLWYLVRRRSVPELMEVLRFRDEDLAHTPPVRVRRRWYGDYPYRTDPQLAVSPEVYELDGELELESRLSNLRWEGPRLVVEGYAYIRLLGARKRRSQRVEVVVRRPEKSGRTRRFRVERVHRPDVTSASNEVVNLDWSGFRAALEVARLGHVQDDAFEIGIAVRAGGVTRETWNPKPAPYHSLPPAHAVVDGVSLRAGLNQSGRLTLRSEERRPKVHAYHLDDGVVQLEGDAGAMVDLRPNLAVSRRVGTVALEYPVHVDRREQTFLARVPLADLGRALDATDAEVAAEPSERIDWDLHLTSGKQRVRIGLHEGTAESAWTHGGREVAVHRTRHGNVTLVERVAKPIVTRVEWRPGGRLALSGLYRWPEGEYELIVSARNGPEFCGVSALVRHGRDRFRTEFAPANVMSLTGARELAAGAWDLLIRPCEAGRGTTLKMALDHDMLPDLPVRATVGHKLFELGVMGYDTPVLHVERDLDDDERGGYRQRLLRTSVYPAHRVRPLEDVVLYESYGGRSYSDSPRTIHEELVRREAPLEHRWVVRDGAFRAPETAVPVRELSKDYYESFARARYIVTNDYWPNWSERRPDQIWIQTWHGLPVKKHGYQLRDRPVAVRAYRQALRQRPGNWQYVISPCSSVTPMLESAFPPATEIVEAGLPRTDLLVRSGRAEAGAVTRRRLGLDSDRRVLLYAPTYRDSLAHRDGYRLGPLLELAELHAALGQDWAILFRKHRLVIGGLPPEFEGLVIDVSDFPDATELLLAADVLVTDYSSAIADFVCTGRPVLLYAPDLESYRDRMRGLNLDLEAEAPGPLLRTTGEVIDALRDLDGVIAASRDRYSAFAERYCSLNDGHAAARVVDRVFAASAS